MAENTACRISTTLILSNMKKNVTLSMSSGQCATLYTLLREAKLTGMNGDSKLRVVATLHSLRPAANRLEAARKDCMNSLRPTDFDRRLQEARDFEQGKTPAKMQREEYDKFIEELQEYNRLVGEGVKEYASEVVDSVIPLKDEDYRKLISANDWTLGQTSTISDLVKQ